MNTCEASSAGTACTGLVGSLSLTPATMKMTSKSSLGELPVQVFHQLRIVDIETLDPDAAVGGRDGGSEPGRGASLGRHDVPTMRGE